MTHAEVKKLVDETVDWANTLSDQWVGTTTGRVIDAQKEQVLSFMKEKEYDFASIAVLELAETLDYAEKEYDGYTTS